jgi:hypothetical protein
MIDWRLKDSSEGRPYDIICLVLGLIIVIAPWAFGYADDTTAAAISWIAGVLIIVAAAIALSRYTRLFREVNVALGLMTALAPWILRFEANATASVALGILGFLVAFVSAAELLLWRGPGSELSA